MPRIYCGAPLCCFGGCSAHVDRTILTRTEGCQERLRRAHAGQVCPHGDLQPRAGRHHGLGESRCSTRRVHRLKSLTGVLRARDETTDMPWPIGPFSYASDRKNVPSLVAIHTLSLSRGSNTFTMRMPVNVSKAGVIQFERIKHFFQDDELFILATTNLLTVDLYFLVRHPTVRNSTHCTFPRARAHSSSTPPMLAVYPYLHV
eukprot:846961-Prorocentrum_minimum.AAC.5